MVEWYVISEGYGTGWTPRQIVMGRRDAVNAFIEGQRLTLDEKKRVQLFLETPVCGLGDGLYIVRTIGDYGKEETYDRKLTRVTGPGTEV